VFKVKRSVGHWDVEIMSKPGFDLAVQSIVFKSGTHSGWHRHPGPVFIMVKTGEMTFYESDDPTCTPVRKKAGEGFLDMGDHAHIARNESDLTAENIVTYFVPPGAPSLRIDEPAPGNCPF
jgi:quercetin dioxygenase-like cupin family protein